MFDHLPRTMFLLAAMDLYTALDSDDEIKLTDALASFDVAGSAYAIALCDSVLQPAHD